MEDNHTKWERGRRKLAYLSVGLTALICLTAGRCGYNFEVMDKFEVIPQFVCADRAEVYESWHIIDFGTGGIEHLLYPPGGSAPSGVGENRVTITETTDFYVRQRDRGATTPRAPKLLEHVVTLVSPDGERFTLTTPGCPVHQTIPYSADPRIVVTAIQINPDRSIGISHAGFSRTFLPREAATISPVQINGEWSLTNMPTTPGACENQTAGTHEPDLSVILTISCRR